MGQREDFVAAKNAERAATDLTCNGTYASFTVTGFSGYALTTVPEPGTLALLLTGLFASLACARRKRRNGNIDRR
jgi:hypothetical protein